MDRNPGQLKVPNLFKTLRFFFSFLVLLLLLLLFFDNTTAHFQAYVLEMTLPCYNVKGWTCLCHLLALGFLDGLIFLLS